MTKTIDEQELYSSNDEKIIREKRFELLKSCPIPSSDLLNNVGLFLNSKNLARILFMNHIYEQVVNIHGVIFDFGTRYGQNAALFSALRGIYEPFNRHRKIIAFDTFEGFPSISEKDNAESSFVHNGGLATPNEYEKFLHNILMCQEQDNPISHIKKFEIIKGDATKTVSTYISKNPETIIALAYFDFDIYKPTKECLENIKSRLVKGSVVAFDELADHDSPGETTALLETFGLNNIRLKRIPFASRVSYFVYGE